MNKLKRPPHIGSYSKDDICFLLKEIGEEVEESSSSDREKLIQQGVHYSELLPMEYKPTDEYMTLFNSSLDTFKHSVATYVGITAEKILKAKGENVVLVSLARAGSPVGVLLKRYIKKIHNIDISHYSISIIRGKGFDNSAISYLRQEYQDSDILFVDGWTGKGAIGKQLIEACEEYNHKYSAELVPQLAVIADPGYSANIFGTREDFLLPSACLNSTVSGLVSRTFHRTDIIKDGDYHGARFYKDLLSEDVSNRYIATIEECFKPEDSGCDLVDDNPSWSGWETVLRLGKIFNIDNLNHIKPGVGETTRVLLRRVPWKILVRSDKKEELKHIYQLAAERDVTIEIYDDMEYSCCGLIQTLKDSK